MENGAGLPSSVRRRKRNKWLYSFNNSVRPNPVSFENNQTEKQSNIRVYIIFILFNIMLWNYIKYNVTHFFSFIEFNFL